MKLTLLDKPTLERLYAQEMCADFPKSELKPLGAILRLMDMGQYEPLLVEEHGEPAGYAMMWLLPNGEGALLEYLGILRQKRNEGLGSKLLNLLAARYGQILGEAEAPCSDNQIENDLRHRRIAFYLRNGYLVLDYQCALFGVRFHCLYHGHETEDRKVEAMHHGVYAGYFSPAHMARYIQLPLNPGEAVRPAPEWVEEFVENGVSSQYFQLDLL